MTILVYKDGKWLIDNDQPLEGVSLDNLAAILTNPKDGDVVKFDESSGMWVAGEAIPSVSASDNGKVLTVADGAWAAANNLFLVTKPNVGDADKTFQEIVDAYNAGKSVFLDYNSNTYALSCTTSSAVHFICLKANSADVYCAYITSSNTFYGNKKSILPTVAAANNGSEMIVKDGAWTLQKKKFIVTLTPTSPDYSGTMDKTVAEINAAYEAGQEIVFRFVIDQNTHADVTVTAVNYSSFAYPSFDAFAIMLSANVLVYAYTSYTDDGTKQTYFTNVYSLTPAS